MQVTFIPSPNFSTGRGGNQVNRFVLHWIDGTLDMADKVFQDPVNHPHGPVSAHFGLQDHTLHQYVKVADTAWHAGNFTVNEESIGIEFAGSPELPVSDLSYETGANLLAELCRIFHIVPSSTTFTPHHQYFNTQCPGSLDIPRLIGRVRGILGVVEQPATVVPVTIIQASAGPKPVTLWVQTTAPLNIRSTPHIKPDNIIESYAKGANIEIRGYVISDNVEGTTMWCKSYEHGYYFSAYYTKRDPPTFIYSIRVTSFL